MIMEAYTIVNVIHFYRKTHLSPQKTNILSLALAYSTNNYHFYKPNRVIYMKNTIWLCAIIVGGALFSSSCSKVYDCKCITEITDTVSKESYKTTTASKKRENFKGVAKAKCEEESAKYYLGNNKYVTDCALDNNK